MAIDVSDIVIVGGGIIGLSIAHYLVEKSAGKILVVEGGKPASQASKGNAGAISYMGIFPDRLVLRPLIDLSLKLFDDLFRRVEFDFDFEKAGSVMVPRIGENIDSVHSLATAYMNIRVAARVVEGTALRELSPLLNPRINSVVFFPEEARGNSAKLSAGLARTLTNSECRVASHTMVTGFEVKAHAITAVKTNHGQLHVRNSVVLAAGPWSYSLGRMVGVELPVDPAKGHMVSFHVAPQKLGPTIVGKDIVVVQSKDGQVRSGGFVDMDGFDDRPNPARIRDVSEETFSLLPSLRDYLATEEWAGLRPRTPDSLPILGRARSLENLFIATGHFKKGFCLSQATGLLISELVTERKLSLPLSAFSPDRFR